MKRPLNWDCASYKVERLRLRALVDEVGAPLPFWCNTRGFGGPESIPDEIPAGQARRGKRGPFFVLPGPPAAIPVRRRTK